MKKLIYICLVVFVFAFSACSKPEKKEGFETIHPDQIPTAEDIKFKESKPEKKLTEKEQDDAFFQAQKDMQEKFKRKIEERKRREVDK